MSPDCKGREEVYITFLGAAEREKGHTGDMLKAACKKAKGESKFQEITEERYSSIVSIMFSVFALESYINMKWHDFLDKDIWNEYERLNIEQKWHLFPLLMKKKTFDRKSRLFKDFKKIIKWRNDLVHYKDYDLKELVNHPSGSKIVGVYEITNAKNAKFAYNTAKKMIDELESILR